MFPHAFFVDPDPTFFLDADPDPAALIMRTLPNEEFSEVEKDKKDCSMSQQ